MNGSRALGASGSEGGGRGEGIGLLSRDPTTGVRPTGDRAREALPRAIAQTRDRLCTVGRTVAIGSYFGQDVRGIVDRLLTEQMADGGWNCEVEHGATVSSFGTTINVLEGLLEFERATGGSPAVKAARERGQEYLLERNLFRRRSTGEVVDLNGGLIMD